MPEAFAKLKAQMEDIVSIQEANALLDWDMQTKMPPGGAQARARQLGALSKLHHEKFTADEIGKLIEAAAREVGDADYDGDAASLLRVVRRDYTKARKLPADLVGEISRATTLAHGIWVKARADNNFKAFAPSLQQILDLKRRAAECIGYTDHIYDAFLDDYEPGLKTADVDAMYADLRTDLVPLVHAVNAQADSVDDSALHQEFDTVKQREFAEMVVQRFGFDFERGRQDRSAHPFCTSFSRNDVRITTRFDPKWLNPAMFGTFHESGHGMYEQGVDETLDGTPLGGGTSLGVHESQSRLWENIVGRSLGFWKYFYPKLQDVFPTQLKNVELQTFYRAINKVRPSFIRVEADEAMYNLHVLLRFELEKDLVSGVLKVSDLPEAWNAKFKAYLGVTPPTDAQGVLQDVHWSSGLMGYFPTYSMGTLLSVQLYEKAVEACPSIPAEIEQGQFSSLLGWLHENIHKHGRKFESKELVKRVTGEALQSRSFVRYLKTKLSGIYKL